MPTSYGVTDKQGLTLVRALRSDVNGEHTIAVGKPAQLELDFDLYGDD